MRFVINDICSLFLLKAYVIRIVSDYPDIKGVVRECQVLLGYRVVLEYTTIFHKCERRDIG